MANNTDIAKHISSLCHGKWEQYYTRSKILTDPLYAGVYNELKSRNSPLLDIGCGLGILGLYLRECSWLPPIVGIDFDTSKIENGKKLIQAGGYQDITLIQGDVRTSLPHHSGDVVILDILQFIKTNDQKNLLTAAAHRVAPEGKLIIRSGLKAKSIRYFITWCADLFAKSIFWMKSAPAHYPTADFFHSVLQKEGFSVNIKPFWGKTPFNNYNIMH